MRNRFRTLNLVLRFLALKTVLKEARNFVKAHIAKTNIKSLLAFYKTELEKSFVRDDYRELVELCVVFLGGDTVYKLKLRPPELCIKRDGWREQSIL